MKRRKMNIALTLLVIFVLMVLVIIYTTRLFYRISVANIYEVGEDKISSLAVTLENYLDTAKSVLWVTADTVDDMSRSGDGSERILRYLMQETTNQEEQFDENYTGLYGYIQGVYLDGLGWVPPEGYEPTERDWYIAAKKAAGECTIVSPYVDAQTGAVIISFSRLLSDQESVLSLDVTMNKIQSIIQNVNVMENGFGFIVNEDGLIIAHGDESLNGSIMDDLKGYDHFLEKLEGMQNGRFETEVNGEKCTVFASMVFDQWYVVIVVADKDLFRDVWAQLTVNILVYLVSFSVISLVCFLTYRSEWRYSQRVEELKINEQKQEYEAKVLRLEKAAADAANKAKGDFLAEMSHEIRTPINAVLGMNEMILRESKERQVLQYAQSIQASGKTLLSIINDVLDFSKIEDGKMEIRPVPYDLADVIQTLVNSIRERAKAKALELKVEVDEALPARLWGDDVRVTQVIMNLLTNAVKYTEKGTVTFTIRLGGWEDEQGGKKQDGATSEGNGPDDKALGNNAQDSRVLGNVLIDVCVRDTGIGIKEEDRAKLFESFERLEENRNRHIEGTGLGMSIVVKLLTLMGSEIHLESEYGKGSAFSFRLKQGYVSKAPIGDYEKRASMIELVKRDQAFLYAPKASVLVVDDNDMNLQVAKNLMKRNGIVPDLASSGAEAMELLRGKRYDLILLDHMMPKMDGIETLAKMKEEKLLDHTTYVIALTANAVVGARETYLAAGFDDYLSKPIDAAQMEEKMAKCLPKAYVTYRSKDKEETDDFVVEFLPKSTGSVGDVAHEIFEFSPMDNESAAQQDDTWMEKVRSLGVSVEHGLAYCGDDPEFYLSMLHDFTERAKDQSASLDGFFGAGNWKEYQILVHAMKTACKTVGLDALSEQAKGLEGAAGGAEEAYLSREHAPFLAAYRTFAEKLRREID